MQDFANLFFIPTTPPLTQNSVVNFNKVFSVPQAEFAFALSNKVLQMKDDERVKFKLKLGYHFSRPTQAELSSKIYPTS